MLLLCVCSAEKRNSYRCGTTWRSVNNDLFEGIVCPKNKIVIIYSHSRRSEPVRRFSSVEYGRYFEECLESNQSPLTWITVQYSTWKYNRKSMGNKKRFSHHAAFEERNAWHKCIHLFAFMSFQTCLTSLSTNWELWRFVKRLEEDPYEQTLMFDVI